MVMPPPHVITPAINALGTIFSAAINQGGNLFGRSSVPSPFEKETLELRRQEIAAGSKRFQEEMTLRWQQVANAERQFLAEADLRRELQLNDIANQWSQIDHKIELDRWPLKILPKPFRSASRARQGRSLNVILYASGGMNAKEFNHSDGDTKASMLVDRMLRSGPLQAVRGAVASVGQSVTLYDGSPRLVQSGSELVATLWEQLGKEPTVLIEVSVPIGARSVQITVSHWGNAFSATETWETLQQSIRLPLLSSGKNVEAVLQPSSDAIAWALCGFLIACSDAFQATRFPSRGTTPAFAEFVRGIKEKEAQKQWKPLMSHYVGIYDQVALQSPLIASEMAAGAAAAAHAHDLTDFSALLLEKALEKHPLLEGPDDPALPEVLRKQRSRKELPTGKQSSELHPSELEQALRLMRQVVVSEPPPAPPLPPPQSVRESVRGFRLS